MGIIYIYFSIGKSVLIFSELFNHNNCRYNHHHHHRHHQHHHHHSDENNAEKTFTYFPGTQIQQQELPVPRIRRSITHIPPPKRHKNTYLPNDPCVSVLVCMHRAIVKNHWHFTIISSEAFLYLHIYINCINTMCVRTRLARKAYSNYSKQLINL